MKKHFHLQKKHSLNLLRMILITGLFGLLTVAPVIAKEEPTWPFQNDPGLRIAKDAGFVTNLDLTASPTIQEEDLANPLDDVPEGFKIRELGLSQTIGETTITLDWMYKDIGSMTLMLTSSGLPVGTRLEMPKFTYDRVYTYDMVSPDNEIMRVTGDRIIAIAYEVANPDNPERTLDLAIDIPLVNKAEPEAKPLEVFHFELKDVPVPEGQGLQIQQTNQINFNGFEVQMRSVRIMAETTEIKVCYGSQNSESASLPLKTATFGTPSEEGVSYSAIRYFADDLGLMDECALLTFPYGNTKGDEMVLLKVTEFGLADNPGQTLAGDWSFSTTIPGEVILRSQQLEAELAKAASLPPMDTDPIRMTLDWVYADENRFDFGFHLYGLSYTQEASTLEGSVTMLDKEGTELKQWGSAELEWMDDESGTITGHWSAQFDKEPLSSAMMPVTIHLTLDGRPKFENYQSVGVFVGKSDFSDVIVKIPGQLIGTFKFEADVPVYAEETYPLDVIVKVNDIPMRLVGATTTPVGIKTYLCYPKPSAEDWMTGGTIDTPVLLESAGVKAPCKMYALIYDKDYGGWLQKEISGMEKVEYPFIPEVVERCIEADFPLGKTVSPQPMTLTVPLLEQSQPEIISEESLDTIREELKQKGIEFDSFTATSGSGGGGGLNVTAFPEEMTYEEAYDQIMRMLGYIHDGPWEFKFELP